jgi:hypothetical protein
LTGAKTFLDLLERELTKLRSVARHMDHRHELVLGSAGSEVNLL